ncbi:MAG: 5-deoxy-glucuronate isomerase, partial [Alicyclobacillus sp.]|nr:5-deoxy-glucuronate isomerase [Alicyclobacillus sp.]
MSKLWVRANRKAEGREPVVRVTPELAGWTYIGLEVYRLHSGQSLCIGTEGKETAVIVLEGACDIAVDGEKFTGVGGRNSVFDAVPPEAVYSPPGPTVEVTAGTDSEVAVATSAADRGSGRPRV